MSSINKNTIPMQTRTIQDLVGREMVKIHDRKCKTSFAEERAHLQVYLDDLKRSESVRRLFQ